MSITLIHWAFSQNLEPSRKFVLVAIADHVNQEDFQKSGCTTAWPSVATLADRTGYATSTIEASIKDLCEAKLISKARRTRGNRSDTSNCYTLNVGDHTPDSRGQYPRQSGTLNRNINRDSIGSIQPSLDSKIDSDAVASLPRAAPPTAPTIFSEMDFVSDDGSVYVSGAEFAELERRYPNVKNIRGLLRHACRSWLVNCAGHRRKQRFLEWLPKREEQSLAKAKLKDEVPKGIPDDLYIDPYWPAWKKETEIMRYWEERKHAAAQQRSG